MDALHLKGWYRTEQDDDKPLDVRKIEIRWEVNKNIGFITEDISRRLFENWATNRIAGFTWNTLYRRNFLSENKIEFPKINCYSEDQMLHLAAMCSAKKYFMLRDSIYIYRVLKNSSSHKADVTMGIKSMSAIAEYMKKTLDKIPELNGNRHLKEQCIIQSLEVALRAYARPFYDGVNVPAELDNAVYKSLFPIFGENTTLVKHLFHGYNNMWRQAQIFAVQRNYLAQQNHLLKQKLDALTAQQKNLNSQLEELLKELFGSEN